MRAFRIFFKIYLGVCASLTLFCKIFSCALKILVVLYQKTLSLILGRKCRFYPSCSNYALWILDFNAPFQALPRIVFRIFSCNPLHCGGIDYPILKLHINVKFPQHFPQKTPKYWLLPYQNPPFLATILRLNQTQKSLFYIIKSL
ncbi:membrane protein insertion efficiency factor YidD [Helicobacter himalayensis]|uniref:membrane protein insertion efficiency factor YidD n=1 Tax=Helicobacter himalayensis TaxID=1591088 RepID=UPI003D6F1B7E